jgi:hypothetical protein
MECVHGVLILLSVCNTSVLWTMCDLSLKCPYDPHVSSLSLSRVASFDGPVILYVEMSTGNSFWV